MEYYQTFVLFVDYDYGTIQSATTGPCALRVSAVSVMEDVLSEELSEERGVEVCFGFDRGIDVQEATALFTERTGKLVFWHDTTWVKDDTWVGERSFPAQSPQLYQGYVFAVHRYTHEQHVAFTHAGRCASDQEILELAEQVARDLLNDPSFCFGDLGSRKHWVVCEALHRALPDYYVDVDLVRYFTAML